jgi:hypothetical protein
MYKFLISTIFSFSFVFSQVSNNWWIDGVNGSDNNNGYTEATAFKTIQKVFDSYLLGNYTDTIRVKPGTYDFSDDYIGNANIIVTKVICAWFNSNGIGVIAK